MIHRRRLIGKSSTFGVSLEKRSQHPFKRQPIRSLPKPVKFEDPEDMEIIVPKIQTINIQLLKGESMLFKNFSDPNNMRRVQIISDQKINIDYDIEFIDHETTKITATNNISGDLQVFMPSNERVVDIEPIYSTKTGIFKIPVNLSKDNISLNISSFILNGVEQLTGPVHWEVLNMYFITPENKICKYDYVEMFYKIFAGTRITTIVDPDFVFYGTELIQQFEWPVNTTWSVTVSGDTPFEIKSEDLEQKSEFEYGSKIIEWNNLEGIWESLWVNVGNGQQNKKYKGSWTDVVEKLGFETFSGGIIHSKSFEFCLMRNDKRFLFSGL